MKYENYIVWNGSHLQFKQTSLVSTVHKLHWKKHMCVCVCVSLSVQIHSTEECIHMTQVAKQQAPIIVSG